MKILSVGFLSLLIANSYAEDAITPKDRFLDIKTGKLLRICEGKDSDLVVKEECGKSWQAFPRKREELAREVDTNKGIAKHDLVLFPVMQKDKTIKIEFGQAANIYENGSVHVFQSESQKTGFSKGATHYTFDSSYIIKLDKKHPLLSHASLCAKDDTEIQYSYNTGHSFSLKKGEKVALKGIFENQTAVISINGIWNNLLGYGLNNQLTVDLTKLEVCEDDKQAPSVDDTSRRSSKLQTQEQAPVVNQDNKTITK
ncbi:MAG: hypothetical protein H7177_04120 [Rhizobacter sp.]|nr:hypothetical protein [Bacteriovorax sp.]